MTCYKAITFYGRAYIYYFKYKKDVLNVTKMETTEDFSLPDGLFEAYGYRTGRLIGAGFHSAKSPKRFLHKPANYTGDNAIIARFTIPKGSKYYLDNTGLVVSDQIILKETIFDVADMDDMYYPTRRGKKFSVKDLNGKTHHINPEETDMNKFKTWER